MFKLIKILSANNYVVACKITAFFWIMQNKFVYFTLFLIVQFAEKYYLCAHNQQTRRGGANTMINRTLVRTKVILTLFAYFQDAEKTKFSAEKELLRSFSDTYNLYFLLIDLINQLTSYAQLKIDEGKEKAQALHIDYNPNPRFVNNRFAEQVFENRQLRHHIDEQKLSWDTVSDSVGLLLKQIYDSDIYKEYMNAQESSYEADKNVWRKIFTFILPDNPNLENALDELEVVLDGNCWTSDMDVVMSYVVKTIKRFKEENGADQPLLEMFDHEEELEFAKQLLKETISHSDEYQTLIEQKLKNWDAERIAFMDMLIMKTALAELFTFPEIAVQITINEYLDIAREYSTDNSPQFINGLLDEIIKEQTKQGNMVKGLTLKN